jgi:hypothetical protein
MEFIPRVQKSVLSGRATPVPVAVVAATAATIAPSVTPSRLDELEAKMTEILIRLTALETAAVEERPPVFPASENASVVAEDEEVVNANTEESPGADPTDTEPSLEALATEDLNNMPRPKLDLLAERLGLKPVANHNKFVKAIRKALAEKSLN